MTTDPHSLELLSNRLTGRFGALLDVLAAERAALLELAPDTLEELVPRKNALCSEIAEDQRLLVASLSEAPTPPAGMVELRSLARRCQHENALNGRIVNRARHTNREMLRVLTGEPPADLYQPPGHAVPDSARPSAGHRLGSA